MKFCHSQSISPVYYGISEFNLMLNIKASITYIKNLWSFIWQQLNLFGPVLSPSLELWIYFLHQHNSSDGVARRLCGCGQETVWVWPRDHMYVAESLCECGQEIVWVWPRECVCVWLIVCMSVVKRLCECGQETVWVWPRDWVWLRVCVSGQEIVWVWLRDYVSMAKRLYECG